MAATCAMPHTPLIPALVDFKPGETEKRMDVVLTRLWFETFLRTSCIFEIAMYAAGFVSDSESVPSEVFCHAVL